MNEPKPGQKAPVYLTFDDGPHPEVTPKVLTHLSNVGAKATFFVQGDNAERYPEIIERIVSEGHSLGTHSWSHMGIHELPLDEWLADIEKCERFVSDLVGQDCLLFRPPYGFLSSGSFWANWRKARRLVMWSHDTKDYAAKSPDELIDWYANNKVTKGAVVLMHDNHQVTGDYLGQALVHWQDKADFRAIPMHGLRK